MASLIERETIINFNAAEKTANIWSCDPSWIKKIKKLPEAREHQNGWEADIPKAWLKISKPRTTSTLQKKRASEHAKKLNAKRKKG